MSRRWGICVGRRGAYLLLKAVMFAGHGVLYLAFPPTVGLQESLRIPLAIAPLRMWGVVWSVAAGLAVWSAFRRGPLADRFGFYALVLVATTWAVSYIAGAVSGSGSGFAGGWVGALLYGSLAAVIIVVSGWPEPINDDEPPRRREEKQPRLRRGR